MTDARPLARLVYALLVEGLVRPDDMERLATDAVMVKPETPLTNGWIGRYAIDLANRLEPVTDRAHAEWLIAGGTTADEPAHV